MTSSATRAVLPIIAKAALKAKVEALDAARCIVGVFDAFNDDSTLAEKLKKDGRQGRLIREFMGKMTAVVKEAAQPVVEKKAKVIPYDYNIPSERMTVKSFRPPVTAQLCPACGHSELRMDKTQKQLEAEQAALDKTHKVALTRFHKKGMSLAGNVINSAPKAPKSAIVRLQCMCSYMNCLGRPETNNGCSACTDAHNEGDPFEVTGNPRECSCEICKCKSCRFTTTVRIPLDPKVQPLLEGAASQPETPEIANIAEFICLSGV